MNEKEDALIICSMSQGLWTNSGHFVVVWKIQDDRIYINDPASIKNERLYNSFNFFAK